MKLSGYKCYRVELEPKIEPEGSTTFINGVLWSRDGGDPAEEFVAVWKCRDAAVVAHHQRHQLLLQTFAHLQERAQCQSSIKQILITVQSVKETRGKCSTMLFQL